MMQRALFIGVAGSVVLYSAYMLIHGESPRPTQRLLTTQPAPIKDHTQQPAVSGSVTSLTHAIAQDGNNPHLFDRPVALGGDQANTGDKQEAISFKSLEQQKTLKLTNIHDPNPSNPVTVLDLDQVDFSGGHPAQWVGISTDS
jgi:hypothetical protein